MSRNKCPECGAGRGLAQYSNGDYCHACKYKEHTKHLIMNEQPSAINGSLELPIKDTEIIPKEELEWLQKYNISKEHINKNNIFYSELYKRICFPRYTNNEITACWLRSIKTVKDKWLFIGDRNEIYYFKKQQDKCTRSIAVCEDLISAIRLSDHMDTLCLCGTNSNNAGFVPVFINYSNIVCFLDGDEAGRTAAENLRQKYKILFNVRKIFAIKDPKCHSNKELKELLNEYY